MTASRAGRHASPSRDGFEVFRNAPGWLFAIRSRPDAVELVSGDDPVAVVKALAAAARR